MFGNWKMGGNNLSFDHQAYADKKTVINFDDDVEIENG
jgi:hypothetical protein